MVGNSAVVSHLSAEQKQILFESMLKTQQAILKNQEQIAKLLDKI